MQPDIMIFDRPSNADFHNQVRQLAERLGVEPVQAIPGRMRYVLNASDDGSLRYDVFDIVNAVLDRLDKAAQ